MTSTTPSPPSSPSPSRSPTTTTTPIRIAPRRHHTRKPLVKPPPLDLGSIDEDSEYDGGHLNLGAESPLSPGTPGLFEDSAYVQQWAAAGRVPSRIPSRRPSSRMLRDRLTLSRKDSRDFVDRDCGICFEYAVVPCRTLCCGKIFCTEHLRDWLHGPNAEGRCPNCENPCSLQGGTLSLSARPKTPVTYTPSPLIALQAHHNDTLQDSEREPEKKDVLLASVPSLRKPAAAAAAAASNASDSASTSSGMQSVNTSEDETSPQLPTYTLSASASGGIVSRHSKATSGTSSCSEKPGGPLSPTRSTLSSAAAGAAAPLAGRTGTVTAPPQMGEVIRLISIVTFVMFLYKLLS